MLSIGQWYVLGSVAALFFAAGVLKRMYGNNGVPTTGDLFWAMCGLYIVLDGLYPNVPSFEDIRRYGAFVILAASPFMGMALFHSEMVRIVRRMVAAILLWLSWAGYVTHVWSWTVVHMMVSSSLLAALVYVPWRRIHQAYRQYVFHKQERLRHRREADAEQLAEEVRRQHMEEEEQAYQMLLSELGK